MNSPSLTASDLKRLLQTRDPAFVDRLRDETHRSRRFGQVLALHNLRKHAESAGLFSKDRALLRIAIIGGFTLQPLANLVEHFSATFCEAQIALMVGEFVSYISEIMDPSSELYTFKPNVILILPAQNRCQYTGSLADSMVDQRAQADAVAHDLLELCKTAHQRCGAQVAIGNFALPPYCEKRLVVARYNN